MTPDAIRCPDCGEWAAYQGRETTLAAYPKFIDAEGRTHHHDRNRVANVYRCDAGHRTWTGTVNVCPALGCDWVSKTY